MNAVIITQKGTKGVDISIAFETDETSIDEHIRNLAEKKLAAHPNHQKSYYDLEIKDCHGIELDFETNIL